MLRLSDEAQVKAYLHPVRVRILQMLAHRPMTQSQVAAVVGVHPANLTHHFKKLRTTQLIELVEERDLGRVVEKYYRARARRFEVHAADHPQLEGAAQRAVALLQDDLAASAAQLDPDSADLICLLEHETLSPELFEQMCERLRALVEEFRERARVEEAEGKPYALNLSLIPQDPGPRQG